MNKLGLIATRSVESTGFAAQRRSWRLLMATSSRLNELRCPCGQVVWIMDSDWRGMGGPMTPYSERSNTCAMCGHDGPGWTLLQQSPPEFLLQPHDLYPMTKRDFDHWVEILRTHFPDNHLLRRLGRTLVRRTPEEALRLMEIHVKQCQEDKRMRKDVPGFQKAAEKFRAMIDQAV